MSKINIQNKLIRKYENKETIVPNDLYRAVANGHFKVVEYFISRGVDINVDKQHFIKIASYHNQLDMIKYFASKPIIDLDYNLSLAIRKNNMDIVKYLISQGAKVKDSIREANNLTMVKYLLSQGGSVDDSLKYISQNGYLDIVAYLISQGPTDKMEYMRAIEWTKNTRIGQYIRSFLSEGDITSHFKHINNALSKRIVLSVSLMFKLKAL